MFLPDVCRTVSLPLLQVVLSYALGHQHLNFRDVPQLVTGSCNWNRLALAMCHAQHGSWVAVMSSKGLPDVVVYVFCWRNSCGWFAVEGLRWETAGVG